MPDYGWAAAVRPVAKRRRVFAACQLIRYLARQRQFKVTIDTQWAHSVIVVNPVRTGDPPHVFPTLRSCPLAPVHLR